MILFKQILVTRELIEDAEAMRKLNAAYDSAVFDYFSRQAMNLCFPEMPEPDAIVETKEAR